MDEFGLERKGMWAVWKNLGKDFFRHNWLLYLIILSVFFLGACLGVYTVNTLPAEQITEIHSFLNSFLDHVTSVSTINSTQAVRAVMYENIIVIGAVYILGLTFVGIPFIFVLVLLRGFLFGFVLACLTKTLTWPGLFLAFVSILPQNLLYIPSLVIGVAASVSFAFFTVRQSRGYKTGLWRCLTGYTMIMIVVMAITLGAGLIEVYFSPWLARIASGLIQMAAAN
jgi:stage II sporulation protein M